MHKLHRRESCQDIHHLNELNAARRKRKAAVISRNANAAEKGQEQKDHFQEHQGTEAIRQNTKAERRYQFAKVAVARYGEGAYYWNERWNDSEVTDKEREAITIAVERQMQRMEGFLLNDKLRGIWL